MDGATAADATMVLVDFLPTIPDRSWSLALQMGVTNAISKSHSYSKLGPDRPRTRAGQDSYSARSHTMNGFVPGGVLTDRNTDALANWDCAAKVLSAVPVGRLRASSNCIGIALFLCSDAAFNITG